MLKEKDTPLLRVIPVILLAAAILLFFAGYSALLALKILKTGCAIPFAGLSGCPGFPAPSPAFQVLSGLGGGIVYFAIFALFGLRIAGRVDAPTSPTAARIALFSLELSLLCAAIFAFILSSAIPFEKPSVHLFVAAGTAAVGVSLFLGAARLLITLLLPRGLRIPEAAGTDGWYPIISLEEFIDEAGQLLSQAGRHNLKLGLFAIDVAGLLELAADDSRARTFLRKQLIFLLTDNARRHEPWTRTPEKDIYINVMLLNSETEFDLAATRFLELLGKYEFTAYEKRLPTAGFPSEKVCLSPGDDVAIRPAAEKLVSALKTRRTVR